MSRIAYVNGRYLPHQNASVHIEDRGYQFSDGVYEVWHIAHGKLQDHAMHMQRLQRSLRELHIPFVPGTAALDIILYEIIRRNRIQNGMVYLQITRGVAPRDHAWDEDIVPALVITAKAINPAQLASKAETGVSVATMPDERWHRCDIKSVSLLPNVLAKQQAKQQGAYEAWLLDEQGFVREGSSTSAWIVTDKGELVTRQLSNQILSGVTRMALLQLAEKRQLKVTERKFSLQEAQSASEAFLSSATTIVMPVTRIDGVKIGDGKPGAVAKLLRQAYLTALQ
ncbi:D-alanine aminotransferase [hydrothermal vent metagenome]|uniref:D-alanine aminotransferase n=1 Tax=hydrothermal vent metagenome TaxID=652676 RepID=A0A3B0T1A0_9ZZZZ